MGWVKASDYIFHLDEISAVGPQGYGKERRDPSDPQRSYQPCLVSFWLKSGVKIDLEGPAALKFRELFMNHIAPTLKDFDAALTEETMEVPTLVGTGKPPRSQERGGK